MSTISNSYNSSYYQLGSQQTNTQTAGTSSTNQVASLADALSDTDTSNNSNNNAYLLDLSPEAQAYLSSANSSTSTSSSSSSTSGSSNSTFTLTAAQQQKIQEILEKYKDAPLNQDTYDKIQDDLKSAGLGADQLSAKDQISSFNGTAVLIDALSGVTDSNAVPTTQDEQSKANNYMQSIMNSWQSITTQATDASSTDTDTTTTAGAS